MRGLAENMESTCTNDHRYMMERDRDTSELIVDNITKSNDTLKTNAVRLKLGLPRKKENRVALP